MITAELLQGEELAYLGSEAAREPQTAPLPDELHPRVRDALAAQGIEELYTHQAEAWEAAARGEHLIVTTGTASGKTLAFNLPVLDAFAREPKERALYLYPTKALAQDQLRSLGSLRLPRLPARPHCWRSEATVPGKPTERTQSSRPMSIPSSSAFVAETPSNSPSSKRRSISRRCMGV